MPSGSRQWRGKAIANLAGISPDDAWSLIGDFCGLHRLVPSIDTCRKISGGDGKPGCIRYCAGTVNRSDSSKPIGWSKERLIAYDDAGRSYSYVIVDNNKGFGRYNATVAVVPGDGEWWLEWSFAADPVKGWTENEFVGFFGELADAVVARIKEEIKR